jgi:hypothetical protein
MNQEEKTAAAEKIADFVMSKDAYSYRGRRKEGRKLLIKHILDAIDDYEVKEPYSKESEDWLTVEESAGEFFQESWLNRE